MTKWEMAALRSKNVFFVLPPQSIHYFAET